MFKKTLAILIPFAVIAVMVFGVLGSGAWFTNVKDIENNSVTTGTLELNVWGGPFNGVNLEPGADYTSLGVFCVQNVGDYDMKWRGWVYDVGDANGLSNYLLVKAVINPTGNAGNYGPSNTPIFTDIPFNSLVGANGYIILQDPADKFEPGHYACYDIQAKLHFSAPNTLQNSQLTAKFHILGTQYINTGWGE